MMQNNLGDLRTHEHKCGAVGFHCDYRRRDHWDYSRSRRLSESKATYRSTKPPEGEGDDVQRFARCALRVYPP